MVVEGEDVETETAPPDLPPRKRLPALARGTVVDRYVILEQIGAGGMGVVYRAYDPDLDRRVALKLVRDQADETTERMVREAKALAKVSHPNIVQVFDVGVFADTVFIAMELVEGATLLNWKREESPDWRSILAHMIDAGRGLAAAHAAGLVHRDFKPDNAIVGLDERVRVLDFGLARLTDAAPDPDSGIEPTSIQNSRVNGTPGFMAPEQRLAGTIDSRADQFAFAVSCWVMIYGERPFSGATVGEYTTSIAAGKFRGIPTSSQAPAWIRTVLMRALAMAPTDRYGSMGELLAALSADPAKRRRTIAIAAGGIAVIGGLAVLIAARSSAPGPCEDAARHLDGVWDGNVATKLETVFRATGATFAAETMTKLRGALDRRTESWTTMHREACRATRVSGEQSAELMDLRMACLARRKAEIRALVEQWLTAPDASKIASSLEAVAQLPPIAACADRDALTAVVPLPADANTRAAIDDARGELTTIGALLSTGQWALARTRAEAAQARATAIGWAPLVAEAGLWRGKAERNAGNFAAAETALSSTVLAAARAHVDDVAQAAWAELAWVVGYEEARPLEGLALASAAEAAAVRSGASPLAIAMVAHTRAQILSNKGDQASALTEAERSLALVAKAPDAELESIDMLNTVAMIATLKGDYDRAEATHREVLARRKAAFGDGHPEIADSIDNLGVVMFHRGKLDEAKRDYEEALALRIAALGPDHRDVGTSHNNLGGLLMDSGDAAGATKHLEEALRIYEAALGKTHGDLAIPLSNLGELAERRGDHAKAIEYCTRSLALDETGDPDDPKVAYDLVCLGEAHLGLGDAATARPLLERALKLREATEGDAKELARTRLDLARATR